MNAGWNVVPMGRLCSISSGESDTQDAVADGPYAFFDRSKTVKRSSRYLYDCEALIIPGEGKEFLPTHFQGKFDLHQRAYALFEFAPELSPRFLFHLLHHRADYFPSVAVGATVKSLRRRHFENLPVPLPPLLEQQRIVRILDEALAGIATAKANTEKNLQKARGLFEAHLHAVLIERTGRWAVKSLADICDEERVITYGVIKLGTDEAQGVPCLRTSNVRWLRIETDSMKRIAPALSNEFARTVLRGGEVLVNVRGTLGGVAVALPEMRGWNVSREVAVVPVDSAKADPAYLCYWIGSRVSQDWLGGVRKGAAYVGINIEDLRLLPVRIARLSEQTALACHLDGVMAESRRLEEYSKRKLTLLDQAKAALLRAAFSGAL